MRQLTFRQNQIRPCNSRTEPLKASHKEAIRTLTKPLEIFDVFWHLLPAVLLDMKLYRNYGGKPSQ
jgi:hypothetical protein